MRGPSLGVLLILFGGVLVMRILALGGSSIWGPPYFWKLPRKVEAFRFTIASTGTLYARFVPLHTPTYIQIYISVYIYMCTYTYIYIYMCICVYIYICIYIPLKTIYPYLYIHIHICIYPFKEP